MLTKSSRVQAEGFAVKCFDSIAVGALEGKNHQRHPWRQGEACVADIISNLPAEDPSNSVGALLADLESTCHLLCVGGTPSYWQWMWICLKVSVVLAAHLSCFPCGKGGNSCFAEWIQMVCSCLCLACPSKIAHLIQASQSL